MNNFYKHLHLIGRIFLYVFLLFQVLAWVGVSEEKYPILTSRILFVLLYIFCELLYYKKYLIKSKNEEIRFLKGEINRLKNSEMQ